MSTKLKTIVWDLIPNQYEYKILLVLSQDSFHNICTKLNKQYDFGYREGVDYYKNDPISIPCCIANDENRICAIILNEYNNTIYDQTTIAHELFHVMTCISTNIGLNMNQETTEAWAYFISFYLKVCLECLNEYLIECEEEKIEKEIKRKRLRID